MFREIIFELMFAVKPDVYEQLILPCPAYSFLPTNQQRTIQPVGRQVNNEIC